MKFTCKKTELVQAIQTVSKAVSSKPQMPVLSGIYLKAEEGILELQATDYEIGILCQIDAEIETPGSIVLSGRYLQEVTRRLPGDTVEIDFDRQEKIAHIRSNTANFTLLSMPANDFPTIHELEGTINFQIRDNILKDLIDKTAFACSTDEVRPVFTGCSMEAINASVTMAATNTHRLAVKTEPLDDFTGSIKIIIPAKVLSELSRLMISEIPEKVAVTCTYNQISFRFDHVYLTSRLIEGQFPDYHRVIPSEFTTRVTLDTEEFSSAVDRVSLISRSGDYNVITLEFSGGQVRIFSNNPDIGNAEETMSAIIDGPDVSISFNAKYITDVLKNIGSSKFYFSLNKSLDPAAIRQPEDDTFTYVVTPVRTAVH